MCHCGRNSNNNACSGVITVRFGSSQTNEKPLTRRPRCSKEQTTILYFSIFNKSAVRGNRRGQSQAAAVSQASESCLRSTLCPSDVFTCKCLHGGEQHKFLSSPQPTRPSPTCRTRSTHEPMKSKPNRRVCTYRHWCSPENPRTACWQLYGLYAEDSASPEHGLLCMFLSTS